MNKEQVLDALRADVVGVVDIKLMIEKEHASATNVNRGFGFVEFYNHAAAEMARRRLSSSDFKSVSLCAQLSKEGLT